MSAREMPPGLSRAYLLSLAPVAFLAPVPLFWTGGASGVAILLYEAVLVLLWVRAREGRPVRLSATMLNLAGLAYLFWLGAEVSVLRHGLLRSVAHLLLFTALAKLASLKHPGEARMAMLVVFLLTLASASSSTHVSSLLYLAAVAFVCFRALSKLAVLADFEEAPPDSVVKRVPTPGLAGAALAGAAALAVPLFFALPRLHGPYAVAPFRIDDAFSSALTADRVDLEAFGAAKRSDRVVLRMSVSPRSARPLVVRLREAVFTEYRDGGWTRRPHSGRSRGDGPRPLAGRPPVARLTVDLNLFGPGFLFLPYSPADLQIESGRGYSIMADGVVQATSRRALRYEVAMRERSERGPGESSIDPASVPDDVRAYAWELTGALSDPRAIAARIEDHFRSGEFVYTLDAPEPVGDPLSHFLRRSKAGHCEYFASAAAMMLAARGIRARLVTGSYGGETGLFSETVVVRGGSLHAWVEADLDGHGFSVFDPTPPAGIPPAVSRVNLLSRLATIGRELEFFYDRRILGFDSLDQGRLLETARESLGSAAQNLAGWRLNLRGVVAPGTLPPALLLLAAAAVLWVLAGHRRPEVPPATRAYLSLRRLLARRRGRLSPAVPPQEVARLISREVPAGSLDARAVVEIYCASAFGGWETDRETERALRERVRRLRKIL